MMKTKKIIQCVAAIAVCAAIVVSGITFTNSKSGKTSSATDNTSKTALSNAFTITVMASESEENVLFAASELKENIPFILDLGNDRQCYSFSHTEQNKEMVEYAILAPFSCQGNNIESITYSISKGTFQFVGNPKDINIISGIPYVGKEITHALWDETLYDIEKIQDSTGPTVDTTYYTEYTVSYEQQINNKIQINIAGEGKVSDKSDINMIRDTETKVSVYNEILEDVYITCTVNYTDGTSDSKNIKVVAIADEEESFHLGFVLS